MATWADVDSLNSADNSENLTALVEFLYAEADLGYKPLDEDEREAFNNPLAANSTLTDTGRVVATEGAWAGDLEGTSCVDCHTSLGEDFVAVADDDADGYPTLAKYGSAVWLKDFIRNPGAVRHYGEKNQMPAYSPQQLRDDELDLLVRWMTHDYLPSEVHDYENRLAELSGSQGTSAGAGSIGSSAAQE